VAQGRGRAEKIPNGREGRFLAIGQLEGNACPYLCTLQPLRIAYLAGTAEP